MSGQEPMTSMKMTGSPWKYGGFGFSAGVLLTALVILILYGTGVGPYESLETSCPAYEKKQAKKKKEEEAAKKKDDSEKEDEDAGSEAGD